MKTSQPPYVVWSPPNQTCAQTAHTKESRPPKLLIIMLLIFNNNNNKFHLVQIWIRLFGTNFIWRVIIQTKLARTLSSFQLNNSTVLQRCSLYRSASL
jgi:hypothetical protein